MIETRNAYQARVGSHLTDEQATLIGRETEAMERDGIDVTAPELVKWAKRERSPIHDLFEWDDEKAAHAHRVQQARQHLGALVVVDKRTHEPVRARLAVSVDQRVAKDRSRLYLSREDIKRSSDALEQVHKRLYNTVRNAVAEADSLGLATDRAPWATLLSALKAHEATLDVDSKAG